MEVALISVALHGITGLGFFLRHAAFGTLAGLEVKGGILDRSPARARFVRELGGL